MPMIRTIIGMLVKKGLDVDAFLESVALNQSQVDDLNHRITVDVYDTVQEKAVKYLDDPALGLHMGLATSLSSFGVLGHLLMSAPSIKEVFELFFKYHRLISDSAPSSLEIDKDRAVLTYNYPRSSALGNRIRSEFGLVQVCNIGRHMLGDKIQAIEVHFEHNRPEYAEEYDAVFDAPILYNQSATRLIFPVDILHQPLLHANIYVTNLLEEEAQRQMRQLSDTGTLVDKVEAYLYCEIQHGKPTIQKVAEQFNMNERTLRRKLESLETSFTELLGQVQFALAKKLLSNDSIPIDEIADRLKFSEPSAFYRAFKRWTGHTPAEYREQKL